MSNAGKHKWLLQGKGSQIQINNKTIIEFGSRRILGIIKAWADNTNLYLNSIIV